jgi:hypothetical protein
MSVISNLLNRVQSVQSGLDSGVFVREILVGKESDIMELQKIQLLSGKTSSGDDIRPYYSEDLKPQGRFYSVESAGRYAAWKQTLTYPYEASRDVDVPNLYVNGKFYDEIGVEFGSDTLAVIGLTMYAKKIVDKYGMSTFGLSQENWNVIFTERGGYDELITKIKEAIYG